MGETAVYGAPDREATLAYEARKASRITQRLHPNFDVTVRRAAAPAVALELPSAGRLNIVLVEPNGKVLDVVADGLFEAGRHTLPFSRTNGGSGIRILRIRSDFGNLDKIVVPF